MTRKPTAGLALIAGVIGIGALAALAGCGPSVDVKTDWDRQTDLGRYRTFYWAEELIEPIESPTRMKPHNVQRAKAVIRSELEEKGFQLDAGNPDWLITFHVASQSEIRTQKFDTVYGASWGNWSSGVDTYQFNAGTLIVDFLDAASGTLFWRGWGTTSINPGDPVETSERVEKVSRKIIKKYPPE